MTDKKSGKLKVGILVDGQNVNFYTYELIKFISESVDFSTPTVIHGFSKTSRKVDSKLGKLFSLTRNRGILYSFFFIIKYFLNILISKLEISRARKEFTQYAKDYSLKSLGNVDFITLKGNWSPSGLYLSFEQNDIAILKSLNLDVIIRNNSGILKGDILHVSNHGVWSFHHGDNRVNRGGPSGFWEVYNDEPSSGFILQRLSSELDGGKVLLRGNIMTKSFWYLNNAQLLAKSNIFIKQALVALAQNGKVEFRDDIKLHDRQLYKEPTLFQLFHYVFKVYGKAFLKKFFFKFGYLAEQRWGIAICYEGDLSTSLWRYKSIKNPAGRFLADPFLLDYEGKNFVFVEDYSYEQKKGRISAFEIVGDNLKPLGVILEEEFHLSFPFMLTDGSDVYMIPETSAAKEIRIYRATKFPFEWKLEKVLMSDVSATDTMIFKNSSGYFMLTNICSSKIGEHNSELHLFHSNVLISDNWSETEQGNPIFCDSSRGRNGGFYKTEDGLFRINQIQGKDHYGKAFAQNKVMQLDREGYKEELIGVVNANFFPGLTSTHHFHYNNGYCVIDFARSQNLYSILKEKE
jgi:hypothetical protein